MKTSPPAAAPTNYHTDGVCVFLTVNLYRDERSPKKWHQDFLWRFDRLIDPTETKLRTLGPTGDPLKWQRLKPFPSFSSCSKQKRTLLSSQCTGFVKVGQVSNEVSF